MNMNSLPLAPAQQWQHLRWTIEILLNLPGRINLQEYRFDELVYYALRDAGFWESINPCMNVGTIITSVKGEGGTE